MVEIQSKEIIDKISEELKIQPALQIPRVIGKQIDLSYNVNPTPEIKIFTGTATDTTETTLHTTSTTKDTFICGATVSISKDSNATSVASTIRLTPKGQATSKLLIQRYKSLAAGEFERDISLNFPIKLERGTEIAVTNSTAVASIDTAATIFIYEVDPQ